MPGGTDTNTIHINTEHFKQDDIVREWLANWCRFLYCWEEDEMPFWQAFSLLYSALQKYL